ncbi:MAG: amidase [Hyphomicrobiales bacterium]|nr:amidase [Hyphomicrobiales bacterium]
MEDDLAGLSAHAAAALIRAGTVSAEALMQACLDRIAARDPDLQAFAHIDPARAMELARRADEWQADNRNVGHGIGPLHGVPVAVKDVIDTEELNTEHGSPVFAGRQAGSDASCVRQLRQAGAIVIGKTVTTELASLTAGATRNPHNSGHTPGGSSSGSAVAVATGMAPIALGTQTAGSVLRPASYCGVYGFKPTFGLISRAGVLMQSHTLDTVGVLARSLEDIGLAVDCMSEQDPADRDCWPRSRGRLLDVLTQEPPSQPLLAFCRTPIWDQAETAMQEALEEVCATLGHRCEAIDLPPDFDNIAEMQSLIQWVENGFYYGPLYDRAKERLSEGMCQRLETGFATGVRDYLQAVNSREALYAQLERVFGRFDAIICPASPGPAPKGLDATGSPIFNGLWTYLGVPALSMPLMEADGLPMGLQIVGPRRDDGRLLRTARWLERTLQANTLEANI